MNILNITWDIIRRITGVVSARTLFLKFDDPSGSIVAKDSSNYDYDADYIGSRGNEKWTKSSVKLIDDYFHVPAAPFNFCSDFSLSVWVKSSELDFTVLSCRRGTDNALEITNKRVTVNGTSYTFAS